MKVFVTGGSGFVGQALCRALLARGWTVTVLSRHQKSAELLPAGASLCVGDPVRPGHWQKVAAHHQALVNLAGASIFKRWTQAYKKTLWESRVLSTRHLVQAISQREPQAPPPVLFSASAVGYYGQRGAEELVESSPPGEGFLPELAKAWEAEAEAASQHGARVVRGRFGVVLGPGGGALGQILPLFRLGLGGRLGSGRQWFSWIHVDDLLAIIIFALQNQELRGPVNCTAPQPVSNAGFTRKLARALGRPAFLPLPGFMLRLAMGEMSQVLLQSQKVLPAALQEAGFKFRHPELSAALAQLLGQSPKS